MRKLSDSRRSQIKKKKMLDEEREEKRKTKIIPTQIHSWLILFTEIIDLGIKRLVAKRSRLMQFLRFAHRQKCRICRLPAGNLKARSFQDISVKIFWSASAMLRIEKNWLKKRENVRARFQNRKS